MPRLRARLIRGRRGAAARGAPTMSALTALEETIDASGAAPRIEAMVPDRGAAPAPARPHPGGRHVPDPGRLPAAPLHQGATSPDQPAEGEQRRLDVIADWNHDPPGPPISPRRDAAAWDCRSARLGHSSSRTCTRTTAAPTAPTVAPSSPTATWAWPPEPRRAGTTPVGYQKEPPRQT